MSQKAKAEYLREIKPRYRRADKQEKQRILDEFCTTCGYNRKYAIRLLNKRDDVNKPAKRKKKLGRPRSYSDPALIHFLKIMLRCTNMICSKRLKAVIPAWLPSYEKTFCQKLTELNKKKLLSISAASINPGLDSSH